MGGKKEIYQYIRFFHGALQLLVLMILAILCDSTVGCATAIQPIKISASDRQRFPDGRSGLTWSGYWKVSWKRKAKNRSSCVGFSHFDLGNFECCRLNGICRLQCFYTVGWATGRLSGL